MKENSDSSEDDIKKKMLDDEEEEEENVTKEIKEEKVEVKEKKEENVTKEIKEEKVEVKEKKEENSGKVFQFKSDIPMISNPKPVEEKEIKSDQSIMLDNFKPKLGTSFLGQESNQNKFFMSKEKNEFESGNNENNGNFKKGFGEKQFGENRDENRGFGRGNRNYGDNRDENRGFGRGNRNYGDNRDENRGFGRGNRNFRGGNRGFGGRDRNYGENRNDNRGFGGPNRGFGRGNRNFGDNRDDNRRFGENRDNRGYEEERRAFDRQNDYNRNDDRPYGRNPNNRNNYYDNTGSNYQYRQNQNQNDIEKDPFYSSHKSIILELRGIFNEVNEHDLLKILKGISLTSSRTIFEIMNQITRETKIISHFPLLKTKAMRRYEDRREVFETPYAFDLNPEVREIILLYKVYDKSTAKKASLAYSDENEKRRKLQKDTNGLYNYIPLINEDQINEQNSLYAQTVNEVNFHSLMYKTVICRKRECNGIYCPNAHNMEKDFRMIYDYKNDKICKLMNLLMKCEDLHIEDYLVHFELPNYFSLSSFKIHPCQLINTCGYDKHLCFNYHGEEEKRRPPLLFRYENVSCKNALVSDENRGSTYQPQLCEMGIFCKYIHNKMEFNYHEDNFRKVFKCTRKKKNGVCPFFLTCYGIHSNEKEMDVKKKENKPGKWEVLFNKELNALMTFGCPKCKKVPKNNYYVYLTKCKHLFCNTCFREIMKKENKKCWECQLDIEKKECMRMNFGENTDNEDDN